MKKKIITRSAGILIGLVFMIPVSLFAQDSQTQAVATIEISGDEMAYNTYCLIGAMNDGYWTNTWTKENTQSWLDQQISIMNEMEAQYHSLLKSGFVTVSADSIYINDLSYEFSYLEIEANALKAYIDYPTDETRQAYLDARSDAWEWLNLIDFDMVGKK